MKILIANEALVGGGGVESYLAAVIPALVARGHRAAVLHLNPAAQQAPLRIAPEDVPAFGVADAGLDAALAQAAAWQPDVVFAHNMRAMDVERGLLQHWPVVKMMHGYAGTCVSGQKMFSVPSRRPCTREFGPACLAVYLPRRCGQWRPGVMLDQYRTAAAQHALLPRYRAIVVASGHMNREYARHVPGVPVHTIPLFAPPAEDVEPAPPADPPTVLFLGRMTPLKGGDLLVRAVARAQDRLGRSLRLVMAGVGPSLESWRTLARTCGVDAQFPGWVSGAVRDRLIREAALLAVPSRWPEPFGLTGLEAAARGVPAVAFAVGGITEWLHDGINGILVPDVHATALGDAVVAALADAQRYETLRQGARRVAREFTLDRHLSHLERVLETAAMIPVAHGT
ncbi:MAG TPA: glycosyltransferase family 4 protein [Vicinamibacterales bacterium]|nr:glycosyltransferase family 4 protein [Vicinamibacterales bacterium]